MIPSGRAELPEFRPAAALNARPDLPGQSCLSGSPAELVRAAEKAAGWFTGWLVHNLAGSQFWPAHNLVGSLGRAAAIPRSLRRVWETHPILRPAFFCPMSFVAESTQGNRGLVTFLGTGTSVGVPAIGCDCEVCQSGDPRNQRTRCAITVRLPGGTLLIDTPPDLRTQLIRERIRLVHAVLYTHEHADHIFGLDDLRLIPFRLGHAVPLYCTEVVEATIRKAYSYAFADRADTHPGATPKLEFRRIEGGDPQIEILGTPIVPIPMKHGPYFSVLGFRIGDFAYCTDTNSIPPESIERLRGIKTLVIGALRHEKHPTHFNLDEAIEVARQVGADKTYLTHTGHQLDYHATTEWLPEGFEMAYDGLQVELDVS